MSAPPTVLLPVADGSEDIETTTISDVLVRGDVKVLALAVTSGYNRPPDSAPCEVTLARKLVLKLPSTLEDYVATQHGGDVQKLVDAIDAIMVPGGMPGASNIGSNATLMSILKKIQASKKNATTNKKKILGAICAAPAVVLAPNGLIMPGATATCFPAMKDKFQEGITKAAAVAGGGGSDNVKTTWVDAPAVLAEGEEGEQDAILLTSQGPGTTMAFALAAIAYLGKKETATTVRKALLLGDNVQSIIDNVPA